MTKSKSNLRPAPVEMIEAVHSKIMSRATRDIPLQPSDDSDWSVKLWRLGAQLQSNTMVTLWRIWLENDGLDPVSPAIAAKGFPKSLDVWSWYGGSQG